MRGILRTVLVISAALAGAQAGAAVSYLGVATLEGRDLSGLAGTLDDGATPAAAIGALSGLAWTGRGNSYLVLPDRGPNFDAYAGGESVDNTRSFINRVHVVRIDVSDGGSGEWRVSVKLTGTILLGNSSALTGSLSGNPRRHHFTGLSSGIDEAVPTRSMRLDPEGIRVARDGRRFYVSDEYGPFLYEFSMPSGNRLRSLNLPASFLVSHPAATGAVELAGNARGRVPNKGMEGLAISPDGRWLVGLMQAPLLQDHAINPADGKSALGINSRLLTIDLRGCKGGAMAACPTRQFVYQQSTPSTGNNEILAVNEHQFIVIERDGRAGDQATKLVTLIDLDGATDVTAVESLPATDLPAGVIPVAKRILFDLGATLRSAGQPVLEKYEGLAFGPDLPDGRHLLLMSVDNDFVRDVPSRIYAFALDAADLPGFRQQEFGRGR